MIIFYISFCLGIWLLLSSWFAMLNYDKFITNLKISGVIIGLVLIFGTMAVDLSTPKPINVYQGKTELKVSYDIIGNDTIVKDSTVVWKGK